MGNICIIGFIFELLFDNLNFNSTLTNSNDIPRFDNVHAFYFFIVQECAISKTTDPHDKNLSRVILLCQGMFSRDFRILIKLAKAGCAPDKYLVLS